MPATQQDNDDRWQLALDLARENGQRYQDLVKIVQGGFASLSNELGSVAEKVDEQASEIKALQQTEGDCKDQIAAMKVDIAAMKADGAARAILMRWLLTFGMLNAIGAVIVAALLIYMAMKLFSLAG